MVERKKMRLNDFMAGVGIRLVVVKRPIVSGYRD